ncbi:hypothetical protein J4470_02740 [Candidatus Woesearchaeota archaeon]|nr:hypothetical protein [Candidatus Woesearchaeota archaeon]
MGVDDELLKRLDRNKVPSFDEDKLFPPTLRRSASPMMMKNGGGDSSIPFKELKTEIRRLNTSVNELLAVFSKAYEDIKAEPNEEIAKKLDKLVEQNEEIGRALLLLLELHREHLPQISRHTRISSQLRLRRPPAQYFSGKK